MQGRGSGHSAAVEKLPLPLPRGQVLSGQQESIQAGAPSWLWAWQAGPGPQRWLQEHPCARAVSIACHGGSDQNMVACRAPGLDEVPGR